MSSITTLVTFLTIMDRASLIRHTFQNGKREATSDLPLDENDRYNPQPGNSIVWLPPEGSNVVPPHAWDYWYLPFIYQGSAKDRSGDNLESILGFPNNRLCMATIKEAVDTHWFINVAVNVVNNSTYTVERSLTNESWIASSLAYNATTIELVLSSAIDAVGTNVPTRVITKELVGDIPLTGTIRNI